MCCKMGNLFFRLISAVFISWTRAKSRQDENIESCLVILVHVSNYVCSKMLMPFVWLSALSSIEGIVNFIQFLRNSEPWPSASHADILICYRCMCPRDVSSKTINKSSCSRDVEQCPVLFLFFVMVTLTLSQLRSY